MSGSEQSHSHKRSKSAAALSLLPGVGHRRAKSTSRESPMSSPRASQSQVDSSARSSLRNVASNGSYPASRLSQDQDAKPAPSSSTALEGHDEPVTVGQTVLAFRLYEALRAGDTSFIQKALRSSSPPENVLHLAVQCASAHVLEFILSHTTSVCGDDSTPFLDINSRDVQTGNTPLHIAAQLGRLDILSLLLSQPTINDALPNYAGKLPIDLARTPVAFEKLSVARAIFVEESTDKLMKLINRRDYDGIEALLNQERVKATLDLNTVEVSLDASPRTSTTSISKAGPDASTPAGGSTLLHDAARKKDTKLIQILLLHGADPFRRDRRGKLPQDVTKDDRTKAVLKKSPARVVAERGIEERAVLGNPNNMLIPTRPTSGSSSNVSLAAPPPGHGKESREMKGYLKKWTNYTGGWKLRWFILEDGVLSYYKNQDDVASACRGAINMRIAKLYMDPSEKTRFEIQGKSSVKYHLRANHAIEAKRWYWSLNNAIQWAKDEARSEELKKKGEQERFGRIKEEQKNSTSVDQSNLSKRNSKTPSIATSTNGPRGTSINESIKQADDDFRDAGEHRVDFRDKAETSDAEDDDDSDDVANEPPSADALALLANSARLQLDLLSQVCLALQIEKQKNPNMTLADPTTTEILASYDSAVTSLKGLFEDALRISRERDSYWKRQLEKEAGLRTVWEENMMRLAREQERLESEMGQARDKQKKAKRVLRTVLRENQTGSSFSAVRKASTGPSNVASPEAVSSFAVGAVGLDKEGHVRTRRDSLISAKDADLVLSDGESDEDDEEFFDAVDAGEVEVLPVIPTSPPPVESANVEQSGTLDARESKLAVIKSSFKGYEDPPRMKLDKDSDDRPKISLWGVLKSMIGADMSRMTLPVSFNECTSLLQRVAEDMEYTDLLDIAADRTDPTERMVYVAAFAVSEYASTSGRVAKPFNPLLGETYEYCRPDKGFRFFIEQGESAVKSKFYGKSFDINPLGTWFLRLRTSSGEELYTWKKVTSTVIGIITGSPTVDNVGPMEIKCHTTGVSCLLDFKPRGWRAANAYEVKGRVLDETGTQRWSIGGRWNDKIYARHSPGYNAEITSPTTNTSSKSASGNAAFLVWETHPRPPAPFNLTPFAITLNALPAALKPILPPTDTRLRPDQRAMEDGRYDEAATEKNRLEEKQRAKRREREMQGEEWKPRWFEKSKCEITGEEFWRFTDEYWKCREEGKWDGVEDIF